MIPAVTPRLDDAGRPARPEATGDVADQLVQAGDVRAIDYVACRVPRRCRVEVETDTIALAEHIIDWAALQAA